MFIRASAKLHREAFTLLEIMIAALIIAMLTLSIHRFLIANLTAIRLTSEMSDERKEMVALINMIEAEMHDLPARVNGVIVGIPHKFNNLQADELQWYSRAGNGLFTNAAEGEWYATLAVQPVEKTSRDLELGIRRRRIDALEKDYAWLPLMKDVSALEIRYFDPRVNAWIERWPASEAKPLLVRLRIWRDPNNPPYEAVITVTSALLQS